MPRRIKSLKDVCLYSIAKYINYWSKMIPENPDSYLYLLSPFEVLDHGLTQAVFDALIKHGAFLPVHIHLIFHSNLDSVDLSKCASFKLGESVLKTLLKRCKKIKNLRISGRTRYSKSSLNAIPSHYPNLQSITITHENISDDFISKLVTYCPLLVTFQSSSCAKLKDLSYKLITQLKNIQVLTLGNADELSDAMLLLILKQCNKLMCLSLPMAKVAFNQLNRETFTSIKSIDLTLCDRINDISVENIVFSFENLRELCLSNCDHISDESLKIIGKHCKHLESLNLSYSGIKKYSDEIRNLLIEIGHNLHSVDFSGIRNMRISIFGEYCSHLEKLFLNHCPYMETEWISFDVLVTVIESNTNHNHISLKGRINQLGRREYYSLLELCPSMKTLQLDFGKKESNVVDYDIESVLQGGCNLEMLGLAELPVFTDDDVKKLTSYMDTSNIKHLILSGNTSVTMDGIWYAIEHMTNLGLIEIRGCDVIKNEFDELRNRICKKGYDVEIVGHL